MKNRKPKVRKPRLKKVKKMNHLEIENRKTELENRSVLILKKMKKKQKPKVQQPRGNSFKNFFRLKTETDFRF